MKRVSNKSLRWVMVAGTGLERRIPVEHGYAAEAIGTELAKHRYGLITGGWHGVDYIATEAFLKEIIKAKLNPNDHLIQVISKGKQIGHNFGKIVETSLGPSEWLEPQKYADAVIIIGGLGGTYYTWLGALHDGIPRFPFGGTSDDAELAFRQTRELWELIPVPGITLDQFTKLEKKVDSPESAREVAKYIVEELMWRSLNSVDDSIRETQEGVCSVFISYSRKDSHWVSRIRTLMRPAERRGLISSWVDSDIESGKEWEAQLSSKLNSANAALLLVSPALLESKYIRDIEIPAFEKRLEMGNFHLFWVLLENCDWQDIPVLEKIQAIGDVKSSISESLTKSDEQCRLIDVVEKVARTLSNN